VFWLFKGVVGFGAFGLRCGGWLLVGLFSTFMFWLMLS